MGSYYTHYWSSRVQRTDKEGSLCAHTAGSIFNENEITTGDRIYIISVAAGQPYLFGAFTVGQPPLSQEEVRKLLPYEPWDAPEHLIAQAGTASPFSLSRNIPPDTVKALRFVSPTGEKAAKFHSDGSLDRQTLRGVRELTAASAVLLETLLSTTWPIAVDGSVDLQADPTLRREIIRFELIRNQLIVAQLKHMYHDRCQICGHSITSPGGVRYSEVHHVRPLGTPHNGSDALGNMLCLCPNCHAELDLGCRRLDLSAIRFVSGHSLAQENVDYHNDRIFGGQPAAGSHGNKPIKGQCADDRVETESI